MRFFVDQCISVNIAHGLREFTKPDRHEIWHLQDKFAANVKDPDWIRALRDDGDWIIVSGDPRITTSKPDREAWMESGLSAFFFQDLARRQHWVQLQEIVRCWPLIVERAKTLRSPHGYLLRFKHKELQQIYPDAKRH